MRRRRAIIFEDDPSVLDAVALFFEEQGYDVIACREPMSCAIYDSGGLCDRERPCADILITELGMPGMSGADLLAAQERRGCPLTPLNKALISASFDDADAERIRRLKCAYFTKPFRFTLLQEWLCECERRMDLSRPLGVLRRERREACVPGRVITLGVGDDQCLAEVVNQSRSGICLRIDRQLEVKLEFRAWSSPTKEPKRLVVRWAKPDDEGLYLHGASCG